MDNFTWVDGGAALIILLSAVLAYSRGLVREAMAILGWIGAAIVAFIFAPSAMALVKEIPVVGEMLGESCELSVIAAFALVGFLAQAEGVPAYVMFYVWMGIFLLHTLAILKPGGYDALVARLNARRG